MKAKTIAARLRRRSDEFHRMSLSFEHPGGSGGDSVAAARTRLLADVLQEVADQVDPPSKLAEPKSKKKR